MSRSILNLIFVTVGMGLAVSQIHGQKKLDVCRVWVTPWKWITSTPTWYEWTDGNQEIGKFPVDQASDHDYTRESYRYDADGKTFHIAVDVYVRKKSKPGRIEIGLYVEDSEPSITGDYNMFARAQAMYRNKWGFLDVRKSIEVYPNRYEFHLTCSDGISKDVVHRDEPKSLQKTNKH